MNNEQPRARRVLTILFPIIALVALVLVGRRATTAAPISAPVATAPDAAGEASVEANAPAPDAADVTDVAEAAPKAAVEQLTDGGIVVDLNLASEDDLRKLPGVGPSRAKKILELRTRLGRFKSVDDLARIKGFGKATLRRLRPLTRVGA